MKLLQIGAPKSGNFWIYKILKEITSRSHKRQLNFIEQHPIYPLAKTWDLNYPEQAEIDMIDITDLQTTFRISSIFKMPIENMETYTSKTGHVWTHSPFCKSSAEVFKYFDKKIYIIRDPRDRAISASKYFCSPYMLKYFPQPDKRPVNYLKKHFERLMIEWVWHVYDHLKYSHPYNIYIVFYESLLYDFQNQLDHLLEYLEIWLTHKQKEEIEAAVSFDTMKKESPKHLRKGNFGNWQIELTDSQKQKAHVIAGPLLKFLSYDRLSDPGSFTFANADFKQLKQELLQSHCRL